MRRLAAALFLCLIATSALANTAPHEFIDTRIKIASIGLSLEHKTVEEKTYDVAFWQSRDSNYNVAISGGGGCSSGTFAIDGTPVAAFASSSTTVTSPAFSTTFCNDLIIVITNDPAGAITSVVDTQGHLTFTQVASGLGANGYFIYTAPLSGAALSGDTVTVTANSALALRVNVFALTNYHTASPKDPNAAIPSAVAGSCSWTTSNANDFLFGVTDSSSTTADAGWTLLVPSSFPTTAFFFSEGKFVTTTQTGLTATTINSANTTLCYAIQQGP